MKYYNNELPSKNTYVQGSDNRNEYDMNKRNIVNNNQQYKAQEIVKKTGETSELIIEDNTVYEIDKECISCLINKKK